MSKRITITEDMLMDARGYVSVQEKEEYITHCAPRCFAMVEINNPQDGGMSQPPVCKEDFFRKRRFLMGALVRLYLKQDFATEDGDEWLMSREDYDMWAASHVYNQLERFKANPKVRNKAFDLLADFKLLEKCLNIEAYGLLQAVNDPCTRIAEMIIRSTTPDAMAADAVALQEAAEKLQEYVEGRDKENGDQL